MPGSRIVLIPASFHDACCKGWEGGRVHSGNVQAGVAVPHFFLSYARTPQIDGRDLDDPDIWMAQLFDDLCAHVRALAGLPRNSDAGFMDREALVGGELPSARAGTALSTCRVFVPLYSLKYFTDDRCGREWWYFASRTQGNPTEGIVPALWRPVDVRMWPAVARAVQWSPGGSDIYAAHGFYGIMKLSRYRDVYEEAVYELARRIVTIAERAQVPPGSPADHDRLESAFGAEPARSPWNRVLRVTVVAPRRGELSSGRRPASYDGLSAQAWYPFAEFPGRSVADEAVKLAWKHRDRLRAEVGDLCQHDADLLSGQPASGPQILIVDPRALLLPHYRNVLQRFAALDSPWVQVMVLSGDRDAGSGDQREAGELRHVLEATLGRKLATAEANGAREVRNLPEFRSAFSRLIDAAAQGYRRRAPTFPPAGSAVERPRLLGFMSDVG